MSGKHGEEHVKILVAPFKSRQECCGFDYMDWGPESKWPIVSLDICYMNRRPASKIVVGQSRRRSSMGVDGHVIALTIWIVVRVKMINFRCFNTAEPIPRS
ncbi:hypothetical protein IW261DRAFT_1415406 [Armillaria novae-zelandiae]|uniref:Uncharacterized protein n=1 Tax=Armillaria novae-zelandiae TaxID=153914 RepID=A0AA39PP41_9AGAR|nr:hypothetical protein IW261DRAFT_1415406 [Armillaria novae-zelandiae]